jgi:hypothetical protein
MEGEWNCKRYWAVAIKGCSERDDFSAYNGYPVLAQQKCLAHLRRHFPRLWKLKE